MRTGGDFSGNHNQACGDQSFASHAPSRVLAHHFIKNCIGNLIGNLVWVAFGNGLGRKQKIPLGFAQNVSPKLAFQTLGRT
jgi:hypothetical protein